MGCMVQSVPAAMDLPDSVFIEDTAVVFDEIAVIARPGARPGSARPKASRRRSRAYKRLAAISAPATLDGGDVLRIGRDVYVGVSGRTNGDGVRQLTQLIAPYGYRVHTVETRGCLHLKSAVTQRPRRSRSSSTHSGWTRAGSRACSGSPSIRRAVRSERASRRGHPPVRCLDARTQTRVSRAAASRSATVDMSELAKAEGGMTCCSLIV